MDRFEEFLRAELPYEMNLTQPVAAQVARVLAWEIVDAGHAATRASIVRLEAYAVRFEEVSAGGSEWHSQAAAFVRDALAFVNDNAREALVRSRIMDGATAEDAVKDVA